MTERPVGFGATCGRRRFMKFRPPPHIRPPAGRTHAVSGCVLCTQLPCCDDAHSYQSADTMMGGIVGKTRCRSWCIQVRDCRVLTVRGTRVCLRSAAISAWHSELIHTHSCSAHALSSCAQAAAAPLALLHLRAHTKSACCAPCLGQRAVRLPEQHQQDVHDEHLKYWHRPRHAAPSSSCTILMKGLTSAPTCTKKRNTWSTGHMR